MACVSADYSVQKVGDVTFSVKLEDEFFWPESTTEQRPDGTVYQIEVFPIVTALVVSRTDGAPMSETDEGTARAAVEAHCRALKMGAPGPKNRFAEGAWAFFPCSDPAL